MAPFDDIGRSESRPAASDDWSAARVVDLRSAVDGCRAVESAELAVAYATPEGPRRPATVPAARPVSPAALPMPRLARAARPVEVQRGNLRLTRRGALVAGGIVLAVVIGLLGIARASAPADPAAPPSAPAVVTVQDGDTLWSIAATIAPQRDPRAVVGDLRRINSLGSVDLQPGQLIRTR